MFHTHFLEETCPRQRDMHGILGFFPANEMLLINQSTCLSFMDRKLGPWGRLWGVTEWAHGRTRMKTRAYQFVFQHPLTQLLAPKPECLSFDFLDKSKVKCEDFEYPYLNNQIAHKVMGDCWSYMHVCPNSLLRLWRWGKQAPPQNRQLSNARMTTQQLTWWRKGSRSCQR